MSFFEKIVFKTFLILALLCFGVSSAFAATESVYYSSTSTQFCSTEPSSICAKNNSSTANYTSVYNGSSSISNDFLTCSYTLTQFNYNGPGLNEVSTQSNTAGVVLRKTCNDNEKFELNGCEAKCVVDPCKALIGLQFTKSDVQCGTASCPSGSVFEVSGTQAYCKPGAAFASPRAAQTAVDPATLCSGTLANAPLSGFKIKTASAVGKSSSTLYCTATYTNSGSSSLLTPDETGLGSLSFMDVTETTEDGPCPSNTTKGSYAIGENGETKWICYPDSGSPPTDPTDPPPINCAVGTHYDATTDKCVADTTPPKDTDGDGTPDSEDDTPNGGGGGSNCNAQTGLGCNNPNPDSDTDGDGIPDKEDSLTDSDGDGDADKGDYYSDNCEKTPNCTADPVQCAILRNQWKANCEANRPMSQGEKDLVSSALSKQETENATASSEFSNKVNQIINDNALFSTSTSTTVACIPDKQIHIVGNASITVKYSLLCPYFSLLRNMLILVAYMFAARIVYAEVTGGGIRV